MNKVFNETENGKIYQCECCNNIYIEYKNLNFLFNEKEYKYFANFIRNLDGKHWEERNSKSPFKRKIVIPIGHKNVRVLLNNKELQELKKLLPPDLNKSHLKEIPKFNFHISCN